MGFWGFGVSLMSCVFGGLVAGGEVARYIEEEVKNTPNKDCFEGALAKEQAFKHEILSRNGGENIHQLHDELAHIMVSDATVVRSNSALDKAANKIKEIRERYKNITLDDKTATINQTYILANQFRAMLEISLVIVYGARARNEFRGSHYKPEYPTRDDQNWLKTTIAQYDAEEPILSYLPVDTRHVDPVERKYVKAQGVNVELKNLPKNILLPI